jgi:ParB/RepB/Spo0J family partition protein
MRLKDIAESTSDIFNIPHDKIIVDELANPRHNYGDIEQLAKSISESGQREPVKIVVSPDREGFVVLKHGYRRMRAIKYAISNGADIPTVKCVHAGKGSNEETELIDHAICNDGKSLEPLERADIYRRLSAFGYSEEKIAQKVGRSVNHVKDYLRMLEAPKEIRKAVQDKKLSATAATVAAKASPEKQKKIVEQVQKQESPMKAREVRQTATGSSGSLSLKGVRTLMGTCQIWIGQGRGDEKHLKSVIHACRVVLGIEQLKAEI